MDGARRAHGNHAGSRVDECTHLELFGGQVERTEGVPRGPPRALLSTVGSEA